MVEVEPDLPEPAREPAALLLRAADGALVERHLGGAAGGVEVHDGQQAVLRRQQIRDAVEHGVEVRDLRGGLTFALGREMEKEKENY